MIGAEIQGLNTPICVNIQYLACIYNGRDEQDVSESESELYAAFSARFDIGARTKEVATLLKEDPVVTKIHTQLVRCGVVAHAWCAMRYGGT